MSHKVRPRQARRDQADDARRRCPRRIQNILGEKSDEGVIRDATYIRAERYNWKLSKPLPGQSLAAHRKWLDCWQNIEIADLHYFPLWEKGVFDCLQECFQDLTNIFAHYSKSIGG